MATATRLRQPLDAAEARAYVDALYARVRERWETKVSGGEFMTLLGRGELPLDAVRIFFRNFGAWTIEINTLVAATYQKHLPFFRRHRDLMGPFGAKIAEEFTHPRPPGHVMVTLQTARALGITEEAIYVEPFLSTFRAKLDFNRSLFYEGTIAEWYATLTTEEMIGYWSVDFRRALATHYGFDDEALVYFRTHIEADLEEHDGAMGHGTFNRTVLQRLLEDGAAEERTGYGIDYCAMTSVDLHAQMLRAALDLYREQAGGAS
jgi:pyrroloquinoline quinone (PQQ) biosynthesis protein C